MPRGYSESPFLEENQDSELAAAAAGRGGSELITANVSPFPGGSHRAELGEVGRKRGACQACLWVGLVHLSRERGKGELGMLTPDAGMAVRPWEVGPWASGTLGKSLGPGASGP